MAHPVSILPSRPWFRIGGTKAPSIQQPKNCQSLLQLHSCTAAQLPSAPSCGGAKTSLGLSCQRWGCRARPPLPELGCYAGYRVPRRGIGHKRSPTGRATDAVMLLGGWCGAVPMVSPFSIPAGFSLAQVSRNVAAGRLPPFLWRFASTVVAVSWVQTLFLNMRCPGKLRLCV